MVSSLFSMIPAFFCVVGVYFIRKGTRIERESESGKRFGELVKLASSGGENGNHAK